MPFSSLHISQYSLKWQKSILIFPSLYWSGVNLPFGKMWNILNVQRCKLEWKACLWENEARVLNGSVFYRYLKLCLFHLEHVFKVLLFWQCCVSSAFMEVSWFQLQSWLCQINSGCSFPSPWSCVSAPLSPGLLQAWAHRSVKPTVLLVKEKITTRHPAQRWWKLLRKRKFVTWQGIFLQPLLWVQLHLIGLKDVCSPDTGAFII